MPSSKKPKSNTSKKVGKDGTKKKRINSRAKGRLGEQEFVLFLKEIGFEDARRSEQYSGAGEIDSADIVCESLGFLHFEIKRVQALNIDVAYAQAYRDKNSGQVPVVAHRKNGKDWLITLAANDFMILIDHKQRSQ